MLVVHREQLLLLHHNLLLKIVWALTLRLVQVKLIWHLVAQLLKPRVEFGVHVSKLVYYPQVLLLASFILLSFIDFLLFYLVLQIRGVLEGLVDAEVTFLAKLRVCEHIPVRVESQAVLPQLFVVRLF